jgi:hypothetical protein
MIGVIAWKIENSVYANFWRISIQFTSDCWVMDEFSLG